MRTDYGKRDLEVAKAEADVYSQWHQESLTGNESGLGLDGIFVDEVAWSDSDLSYYLALSTHIKRAHWRSGKRGKRFELLTDKGYVVLNPGCQPHHRYYTLADVVIIFEKHYDNFVHDSKLALPRPSPITPPSKWGVMIHDFCPNQTKQEKAIEMKALIHELVQIKQIGCFFITDIELAKADVYGNWSSVWTEFIDIMAETAHSSSFLF